jgi:hypothetical protein
MTGKYVVIEIFSGIISDVWSFNNLAKARAFRAAKIKSKNYKYEYSIWEPGKPKDA